MAQAPKALRPELSLRHRFGAELRRRRRDRGVSLAGLGKLVHLSGDLLGKVEKAERWPTEVLAQRCDDALAADGVLTMLWRQVQAQREEEKQVPVRVDPLLVGHWAALLRVLASADNALGVHGMHDVVRREAALIEHHRRASGGRLREQLSAVAARWFEFGSWVADNMRNTRLASVWLQDAGARAQEVGDEILSAYVLMRRSQRAVESGDATKAIALAEPVVRDTSLPQRLRALAAVRLAQAQAREGDGRTTHSTLGKAYRLLDHAGASDGPDATLTNHCTVSYVRAYEGVCRLSLGEPEAATRCLRLTLAGWPPMQRLDEGLFRANLALALERAGQPEEAMAEAAVAYALATETGSGRTHAVLDGLAVHVGDRAPTTPTT